MICSISWPDVGMSPTMERQYCVMWCVMYGVRSPAWEHWPLTRVWSMVQHCVSYCYDVLQLCDLNHIGTGLKSKIVTPNSTGCGQQGLGESATRDSLVSSQSPRHSRGHPDSCVPNWTDNQHACVAEAPFNWGQTCKLCISLSSPVGNVYPRCKEAKSSLSIF